MHKENIHKKLFQNVHFIPYHLLILFYDIQSQGMSSVVKYRTYNSFQIFIIIFNYWTESV